MEGLTLSYFSLAYAGLLYDMRESYHWGRSASSMAQSLASPYILREDCALCLGASLEALLCKEPTFTGDAGDKGLIPESGRSLEKGEATHSIILAWRIPWTEEPGELQSVGSQSWTRLSN